MSVASREQIDTAPSWVGLFLIVGKGIDTIEHGGLFREDLGIDHT